MSLPATPLGITIETAPGADVTNPAGWVFSALPIGAAKARAAITRGAADGTSTAQAGNCVVTIQDLGVVATSAVNLALDTPLRLSVDYGSGAKRRFVGLIGSVVPSWPAGLSGPLMLRIGAAGILDWLGRGALSRPLRSAVTRYVKARAPRAYWPCEDSSGTLLAEIAGHSPAVLSGTAQVGSGTLGAGSQSVLTLGADGAVALSVPPPTQAEYSAATSGTITGAVQWACAIPSAPSGAVEIGRWTCGTSSGSNVAVTWSVVLTPGSPAKLTVKAYNFSGTELLGHAGANISVSGTDLYGPGWIITVATSHVTTSLGSTWSVRMAGAIGAVATDSGGWTGPPGNSSAAPRPQQIRFAGSSALSSYTVGHISAWWTDPTSTCQPETVLAGYPGETAAARMTRLCAEEGVPIAVSAGSAASMPMGPQGTGALLAQLRECEQADGGLLAEVIDDWGLSYTCRVDRYVPAAALTVDVAQQQVTDITPVLDRTWDRTDWTVTSNGRSGRYVADPTGLPDSVALNVADSINLVQIAGWLTNLTRPGWRTSALTLNLVAIWSRSQGAGAAISGAWCAADIGDRIDVTSWPAWLGGGTQRLLLGGYTEDLDADTWMVQAATGSAEPWLVATYDGTFRYDSASSTLAAGVSAGATSLSIATADAAELWSTSAAPFTITVGGVQVAVTSVTGTSSPQTFTVAPVSQALSSDAEVHIYPQPIYAL